MLIRRGRIVDDIFFPIADGEPAPASGAILVSLKRFAAERDTLLAGALPLAVRIGAGESPQSLGDDVHRLAAVVLQVGYFKDGRAFSWARLLRTRLGYKGEIRISGHFLKDQIAFFSRVGADSFDISQNISPDDVQMALKEISNVYQPSVDGRRTIPELRANVKDARRLAS